jgi:hypothetical protein
VDRLRTVASVITDDEHVAVGTDPAIGFAADFKPAAPHPLERMADSPDGEPPAGG